MPEIKKILVTGAAGFIGTRLIERLSMGTSYEPRAMVRQFSGSGVARLARLPVQFVLGDMLDPAALAKAAEGCDAIVHCAYGSSGNQHLRRQVTVTGTENLLRAAVQAKVRKVVYLSSAVVHGRNPRISPVDESTPYETAGYAYDLAKIEAEQQVWQCHQQQGLPVAVLRPALVYGPYDRRWVERTIQEIRAGAVLVNDGQGTANLLYIDNLVDAILLAIAKNAADGEAFILVDDEYVTWRDFYQGYAELLADHPPLRSLSLTEIELLRKASQPGRLKSWVISPLQIGSEMVRYSLKSPEVRERMRDIPWAKTAAKLIPGQVKERMKGSSSNGAAPDIQPGQPGPVRLPSQEMAELYAAQARFSSEKIKKMLGYTQRVSFVEATTLIRAWLEYHRLIP